MPATRKIIAFALVLIVVLGVAGVIAWQQFYKPEKAIAGPISIMDDMGRNVTITGYPPERIVSLAPSCTEILFALGLGDKVVGLDEYSDYPPEAKDIEPKVGGFVTVSIETVVGLETDLVLASGLHHKRGIVKQLEELGVVVVVLSPENVSGLLSNIILVGKITGKMDAANALVTAMNERLEEIADKIKDAPTPRVYVESWFNGGYWSIGSGAMVHELIHQAGGINIFAGFEGNTICISHETIISANPEVIIICKGAMAEACGLTKDVIYGRVAWDHISAVENDKIYEIAEDILMRPGPRTVDAIETLAKLFHPELFS